MLEKLVFRKFSVDISVVIINNKIIVVFFLFFIEYRYFLELVYYVKYDVIFVLIIDGGIIK